MKVVSFYTKDTIYEKEVEDLFASCQLLQINHYIEARKDLGNWERNCSQKPLFIYECLERFNEPLLWVDADGILLKKPSLHLPEFDFGLYFNDLKTKHARNGTIYVSPTKKAKAFLLLWYEELQKRKTVPDQPVMIDLIRKVPLKIAPLPIEYSHVFDRDCIPIEKTVVLHFQASRTSGMDPIFWKHLQGRDLKAMRLEVSSKS